MVLARSALVVYKGRRPAATGTEAGHVGGYGYAEVHGGRHAISKLGTLLVMHWFAQVSLCLRWLVKEENGFASSFASGEVSQQPLPLHPPEHVLRLVNKSPSSIHQATSMPYVCGAICCTLFKGKDCVSSSPPSSPQTKPSYL